MAKTQKPLLFILDPLEKLDPLRDTSLCLLAEFNFRGYETWSVDLPDILAKNNKLEVFAKPVVFSKPGVFSSGVSEIRSLDDFSLVLIRKEPPFNEAYLTMTYVLETAANRVFMSNHPAGIRNTNEKTSIYRFAKWMPETLTTSSFRHILDFQKTLKNATLIIKPLDLKGGEGLFKLTAHDSKAVSKLQKATQFGLKPVQAQKLLPHKNEIFDKRILLLNGSFLAAFERVAKKGEFRANLGLGASLRQTELSAKEKKMIQELRPYIQKQGLHLVGIDVMQERLLEINVTCPSGLWDVKQLAPETEPVKSWADFLEKKALKLSKR